MGWWPFGRKRDRGLREQARRCREAGDVDGAMESYASYLEEVPDDLDAIAELCELLLDAERSEDALEWLEPFADRNIAPIELLIGKAHFAASELEVAVAHLESAHAIYESAIRRGEVRHDEPRYHETRMVLDAAYAELHGREQLVVHAAARGGLDGSAGINYRLLGDSLIEASGRIAESLDLETPSDMHERWAALDAERRWDARGYVCSGTIELREGRGQKAISLFEKACELDGKSFAAFRGLGCAMDMERDRWLDGVAKLPDPLPTPALAADVVPDLDALSPFERRVALAAIVPLARALPALAADQARIRVMPIDARAIDYPELASRPGERSADHRSVDAASGLAIVSFAVSRVDELLDVVSEHSWVFAHELAHLAFFRLTDDSDIEPWARLLEELREAGFVASAYQLQNVDELFAMAYCDWLRAHYGLPLSHEGTGDGLLERMSALVEETLARGRFEPILRLGVACPNCHWPAIRADAWPCSECQQPFDIFAHDACPSCQTTAESTACPVCGAPSDRASWRSHDASTGS